MTKINSKQHITKKGVIKRNPIKQLRLQEFTIVVGVRASSEEDVWNHVGSIHPLVEFVTINHVYHISEDEYEAEIVVKALNYEMAKNNVGVLNNDLEFLYAE